MTSETIEMTEVLAILDGLSAPTNEEFMQALRGYSDTGVSLAAAKLGSEGGGGGGVGDYDSRAMYSDDGTPTTIANGADDYVAWNALDAGVELLDRTDPLHPIVLVEGIYAVTAVVVGNMLTLDGYYTGVLRLDRNDLDAVARTDSALASVANDSPNTSLSCTFYIPAGGEIAVRVFNNDGVASRDFSLNEASVQRIA